MPEKSQINEYSDIGSLFSSNHINASQGEVDLDFNLFIKALHHGVITE